MDSDSIRKTMRDFEDILNPPLVLFLKKIYQGKKGKDIIELKSIATKQILLEKVKKYQDFVWVDNGKKGGVAFDQCLKILDDSWYEIAKSLRLEEWEWKQTRNYIKETQTLRNKYCHPIYGQHPTEKELLRCSDTFYEFGLSIETNPEDLEKIDSIRKNLFKKVHFPQSQNADIESKSKTGSNPVDIVHLEKKGTKDNFRFEGKGYNVEIKTLFHDPANTKVLSVNAQVTLELIQDYKIHSCPNKGEHYDYKPTQYITFRDSDGAMDSIFKIEQILIVHDFEKVLEQSKNNFFKLIQSGLEGKDHPLENKELKRLKKYCNSELFKGFLTFYKNNRYYVLSEDVEHLPEKKIFQERRVPRTSGSGEKTEDLVAVYYDLSDFR
tara:strand:+ start:271 stop:1413 length:1143 start_codon:yes stop_codon:yes gene_type:complete